MPDGTQLRAFRLKSGRYRIYHLNTELQIYQNIISPETLKSKMHIFFQNCNTLDFKDCFSEKLYLTCVATDKKRIYQQTIPQNWAVSFIIFWNIWKFSHTHTHSESMEELLIQSPWIFCSSWHWNFLLFIGHCYLF